MTCRPSRNARASTCAAPRRASNARCAIAPATEAGAGRANTASPCATRPDGGPSRRLDRRHHRQQAAGRGAGEAEARLKAAVEAASEGFVVWDEHDRLVMCNSVYRDFFGGREHLVEPGVSFEAIIRAGFEVGMFPEAGWTSRRGTQLCSNVGMSMPAAASSTCLATSG